MRGCTFISKRPKLLNSAILALGLSCGLVVLCWAAAPPARAADSSDSGGGSAAPKDRSLPPEEDDHVETPFTQYGEFNQQNDEDNDLRFLQYGRLFGVGLGGGAEGVLGNRGKLWTGGVPLIQVELQYWFDFHLAIALGFYTVHQAYDTTINNLGHVDVTMNHLGLDLKYYFDTRDLSAPISFANPFVTLGAGAYNKIESSNQLGSSISNNDTEFGLAAGAGLEFAIIPSKCYFDLEGQFHWVTFTDTYSSEFAQAGISDLTGIFWTLTGSVLFTW